MIFLSSFPIGRCVGTGMAAIAAMLAMTASARAQGSLTPSGGPAPTMKTLSQIEPRTLIDSLPFVMDDSGSYYLSTNLFWSSTNRSLYITAANVTLDLNGFAIGGNGNGVGILLSSSASNVKICNGVVSKFGTGIDASAASGVRFEHLKISGCKGAGLVAQDDAIIDSCQATSNLGAGFKVGRSGAILRSQSSANGGNGFEGAGSCRLVEDKAVDNGNAGFSLAENALISESLAVNNQSIGFQTTTAAHVNNSSSIGNRGAGYSTGDDAMVQNCAASQNQDSGISTGASSFVDRCKSSGNSRFGITTGNGSAVKDCFSTGNSADGIRGTTQSLMAGNFANNNFNARDAAGVHLTGTDNTVRDNVAIANDRGYSMDVSGNFVIKNAAANNTFNFQAGSDQFIGPIADNTNSPAFAIPSANFTY